MKGMARSCQRRANHYATKAIYTAIGGDSSSRNMYGNHAVAGSKSISAGKQSKRVYCIEDYKFYDSAAAAEEASGGEYKRAGIQKACREASVYKGKHWRYE